MADVFTERLRLAAGSLKKQATDTDGFFEQLLMLLGVASACEAAVPQGNPSRGGLLAAPARGGRDRSVRHEPPLAVFEAELAELLDRETREGGASSTNPPAHQLRRIAELVELLIGEEAAHSWWLRAADAGDLLAQDTCLDLGIAMSTGSNR